MSYIDTLPPGQDPPSYAWSARIAPLDVLSTDRRRLAPDADVKMFTSHHPLFPGISDCIPLHDHTMGIIGIVEHVSTRANWVYAFGFVSDPDAAQLMRDGTALPEMSLVDAGDLHYARYDDEQDPTTVYTGRLYIRGLVAAPLSVRRPIWDGVRFTVQEH